ncbi:MAG: PAS domain S-box protein [Eubacterium sp.]|nr:PAS domain S-box protein [Candidatus Colimonas fimequi]
MSYSLLATFATITFVLFTAYLFVFTRSQSPFIKYWGFAWIAYCCSLLCLVIYNGTGVDTLLEVRKIADMANLMFILFGSYALIHTKIPSYWHRFFLYMVLLGIICMFYDLELLSYYLPVSVFQIIIVIFAVYNIINKWQALIQARIASAVVFFSWGIFKSLAPIYEIFSTNGPASTTGIELMLSNILNITVLTLYIINIKNENEFSNDLFKQVVEQSKDIIFYYQFKPYPSFKYITNSIKDMTSYPDTSFYADPNFFMTLVAPGSRDNLLEVFNDKNTNTGTYIIKMLNKNAEEYWAEFYRNAITNDNGQVDYILCTVRDVTEMQTAQMEQIKVTQSRNMLLSYISHELRTPITSIAGYMTAINDGVMSGEEEVKEAFDIITSKTLTLKTLIDDLDQLTKLETNQFTFEFMLTNVEELASQLISNTTLTQLQFPIST